NDGKVARPPEQRHVRRPAGELDCSTYAELLCEPRERRPRGAVTADPEPRAATRWACRERPKQNVDALALHQPPSAPDRHPPAVSRLCLGHPVAGEIDAVVDAHEPSESALSAKLGKREIGDSDLDVACPSPADTVESANQPGPRGERRELDGRVVHDRDDPA